MIQIDMPMPKCCDECFALDENGDYPFCLISQDQREYTFNAHEKRMPTCPLKAQEATVEPKRIDLAGETKAWLDEMDAVDALGNIADICIDWDGYRTADGLGGLINEIWAYARYCADRLNKTQGAVAPMQQSGGEYICGACGNGVVGCDVYDEAGIESVKNDYCPTCGRKVKWELQIRKQLTLWKKSNTTTIQYTHITMPIARLWTWLSRR